MSWIAPLDTTKKAKPKAVRRGGWPTKPVVVDGVSYRSISEASKQLGLSWYLVKMRLDDL